jgi:ParB family chromosome partitioning protein
MTTTKITLSPSRDIPFNRLVLSQSNVRRIKAGVSIEELAEDIARRGLLQSINVRAVRDGDGNDTGIYEIPAGGRRFRALELLVKQKRFAKTATVPCVVREGGIAEEDSLAENLQRSGLHPLDQFRAFQTLREKDVSEEDIAARFFVSVNVVKQRLRLASVSPALLDVYAEDGMTLEQLMAFSVTSDHRRQEQVWEQVQNSWSKEPYVIRRMLTEKTIRVSDRRVQFVGLEAFKAAGGIVLRDLFTEDNGGWIEDAILLDQLTIEKLKAEAEIVAAEGWKWVEMAIDFPYGHTNGLRELEPDLGQLSDDEQVALGVLLAEQEQLEEEYAKAGELPEDADERLGELETAIAAFNDKRRVFDGAAKANAGAFISIAANGQLQVERGFVRPEDDVQDEADIDVDGEVEGRPTSVGVTGVVVSGQPTEPEPEGEEDKAIRPLPERLLVELTAHRTLALRDAVAGNPHVAMTALLHKLCLDTFQMRSLTNCLEANVRTVYLGLQPAELKDSVSQAAIVERHEGWKADMPEDEDALWDWISGLDEASRLALLAHCVSFGVNALHEKVNPYGGLTQAGLAHRMKEADRISRAVSLDMAEAGWRPTVDNYLGRVAKPRILEAVREACGEQAAQLIDHLKKPDMAREAERLLDGSGWLPEPLRLLDVDGVDEALPELPDFLSDDADDEATSEDEHYAVAAE